MRLFILYCISIILVLCVRIFPQVPNGGFEQWSGGNPVGWYTDNQDNGEFITQNTDAHSGTYAAKGTTQSISGVVLGPFLSTGASGSHGIPVSQRYAEVTGYYKLNLVGSDFLNIQIGMFKGNQSIGTGILQISANATSYTQFTVPFFYFTADTPDSCLIAIGILNSGGIQVNLGSYFLLDDITLQGDASGIDNQNSTTTQAFELSQNYPNPFNPSTNINYQVSTGGLVSLKVYDVLGNEVATLVNEEKPAGKYSVNFDASDLSSGIYMYKLTAGSYVQTKKMILMK
jgi:Secretion system C-terminal sorting domain